MSGLEAASQSRVSNLSLKSRLHSNQGSHLHNNQKSRLNYIQARVYT